MTSTAGSSSNSSNIIALSSALFLLSLSLLAIPKGNIIEPTASTGPLRQSRTVLASSALIGDDPASSDDDTEFYYIFLQKFPLEHTFRSIFHTEVVLCPRATFSDDDFVSTLDGMLATLTPSRFSIINGDEAGSSMAPGEKVPFVEVSKDIWSTQSSPGCIQLGYGGSSCTTPCCSVPHKSKNVAYALNSLEAVIPNAMGEYKELFLYGSTQMKHAEDAAFRAICHGHYGAIEEGRLPPCVSNWAGTDYNPLTNNCNTFTSTLLKCVFGLSDAKPSLWVSDLINVKCPIEKGEDGQSDIEHCMIPGNYVAGMTPGEVSVKLE
ncbi:hypothetical protein HJC23_013155 [Cyclotella cryptica]|uniref:Uncharacterized protein n=1 Tax=Cyclotella cryptica TaxID=29204 RepID=A0ABD3QN30_9STRA|eukprot:CCRYP_003972-RA/>CCRYP_003972-RA protein AED:0.06 eAED:0.01 QI:0/-1/0/1/-1/1/1/0/321